MRSFPWKLYRVFNYLLLLVAVLVLVLLFISIIEARGNIYVSRLLLPFGGFLLMLVANSINIFLSVRFFPDRSLTGTALGLHIFALVIQCLFAIASALLSYVAIEEEFFSADGGTEYRWLVVPVVFITLAQWYVTIFQFRVASLLRKNQAISMYNLIDSIGSSSSE